MRRLPDWPERLSAAIEAASGRPFSWGEWDCVQFAASCVEALTGEDPIAALRAPYASLREAEALLQAHGFEDLGAACDALFGPRRDVKRARRGDLVLCPAEDGASLGVCLGRLAAFVDERGLSFRPVLHCAAAWPVGE